MLHPAAVHSPNCIPLRHDSNWASALLHHFIITQCTPPLCSIMPYDPVPHPQCTLLCHPNLSLLFALHYATMPSYIELTVAQLNDMNLIS